jgi:DNA polymerase (family X)
VDILEDGSLALPDSLLAELELVVGTIHSHFDLSESRQTMRVLRAGDVLNSRPLGEVRRLLKTTMA